MADNSIDWEKIETQYRAGLMSVREIARDNSVSHTAIQKRAEAGEWERDLKAKIRAKAESLVAKKLVAKTIANSVGGNQNDRNTVEIVGEVVATVRSKHMEKATEHRAYLDDLLAEAKTQSDVKDSLEKLAVMLNGSHSLEKLKDLYKKVCSFPGRVDSAKKLIEAWAKAIEVERKVYGIDDSRSFDTEGLEKIEINLIKGNG